MAHSLSAKKRIRQNAKRRSKNRGLKRVVKEDIREFEAAVAGGDKAKAAEALRVAVKQLGKTAAKGTLAIDRSPAFVLPVTSRGV